LNILYLNHYAGGPAYGMEFRPYYLAREWVRMGHRVRILAASYSHVRARQPVPPSHGAPECWTENVEGVEYAWYRTPAYSSNGVRRALNIFVFLSAVARDAQRIAREFAPGVVVASSTYPMDIWVARRIARLAGATLVFEVHDLWPLSPIELGGMSPRHPFARLCAMAEKTAYREADIVISMLPTIEKYAAKQGLPVERLHIVPNGVAPEDWRAAGAPLRPDVASFIDEQHRAGRLVVCYAGSHGLPNALDVLIDTAAALRDAPLAFVLVGNGLEKARLLDRAARSGNDHLRLFPAIPKSQVPNLLAAVDIAYIGWRRSPIYRFGIAPNKLLDYMMAGCPVVHSVEAGNDSVAEAGCGRTVEPECAAAVAEALRQLAALPAETRRQMGQRGRDYVLSNHTYNVLARRFIDACATGRRFA
jgi:glycosyltransferase involved in cell wall biosynthesis